MFIDHDDLGSSLEDSCGLLRQQQFSVILDLSWGGWEAARRVAELSGVPYLRLQTANHALVEAVEDFLSSRHAVDAALIFETEAEVTRPCVVHYCTVMYCSLPQVDEALYWMIGRSQLRIMVLQLDAEDTLARLATIRPAPSYYVVYAAADTINTFIRKGSKLFIKCFLVLTIHLLKHLSKNTNHYMIRNATSLGIIKRDSRWNFVVTDWGGEVSLYLLYCTVLYCTALYCR